MQHKCKVTVLRRELFKDLQEKYLADPDSGVCPFYREGQEFLFERYKNRDDFWTEGNGSHCAEAWDCISRYIYTALQGGSIMRNWTNNEKIMIACCNDGTRPVIFKIERIDYKAVYLSSDLNEEDKTRFKAALKKFNGIMDIDFREKDGFIDITVEKDIPDEQLKDAIQNALPCKVIKID